MRSSCIVVQGHIPKYDVQGDLRAEEKSAMFSYSLDHLRRWNPGAYIILVGHGDQKPFNMGPADAIIWESPCHPLHENGHVLDMPAQYRSVYKGLALARDKGFERCLKTRADCIIGLPEIIKFCDNILKTEKRRLLLTQQCGHVGQIGDCFMYGNVHELCNIWKDSMEPQSNDGLKHIGAMFKKYFDAGNHWEWLDLVRRVASFRDVNSLRFIDLRWNWRQIQGSLEKMLNDSNDNYEQYYWGKMNGWHWLDSQNNIINANTDFWSEREFYS